MNRRTQTTDGLFIEMARDWTDPVVVRDSPERAANVIEQLIAALDATGRIKRYLVFAHYKYYPAGGWGDLVGAFDDVQEAIVAGRAQQKDAFEVIDLTTMKEIDIV